jgi:hypothetical protein
MPPGRPTRLHRWLGLMLSRHLLRRALALHGTAGDAMLATVVALPSRNDPSGRIDR